MIRALSAVLLGYMSMAVWVMMALGIAWKVLGADFAVDAETNRATAGWIALNLPLSFIGALLGGWMAASIARAKADSAVRALASLVLVLGLWLAFTTTFGDQDKSSMPADNTAETAPPVVGDDAVAEGATAEGATAASDASAMARAEQPIWYTFLVPFLGLAGVMIGGTIRRRAASG